MFIRTQSSRYNERFIPLKGWLNTHPKEQWERRGEDTLQAGHVHKQLHTTTLRRMTVRSQMALAFIQGTHPTPYTPLRSVISKTVQKFHILSPSYPNRLRKPLSLLFHGTRSCCGPGKRRQYSDSLRTGRFGYRIPVEATFSAPVQTGPRGPSCLLYST
jgi:hypothetical protein